MALASLRFEIGQVKSHHALDQSNVKLRFFLPFFDTEVMVSKPCGVQFNL